MMITERELEMNKTINELITDVNILKAENTKLYEENARLREENAKLSALYGKRTDTEIE